MGPEHASREKKIVYVSEAIFPTNQGYVSIEKWSQIFVSGTGSVRTESEAKATFTY